MTSVKSILDPAKKNQTLAVAKLANSMKFKYSMYQATFALILLSLSGVCLQGGPWSLVAHILWFIINLVYLTDNVNSIKYSLWHVCPLAPQIQIILPSNIKYHPFFVVVPSAKTLPSPEPWDPSSTCVPSPAPPALSPLPVISPHRPSAVRTPRTSSASVPPWTYDASATFSA